MAGTALGSEEVIGAPSLPLHFDVPGHFLLAGHYVVAVDSISTTIKELNRRVFENKLQIEIVVLPAEQGSFLSVIKIIVKSAKGVAIAVGALGGLISGTETQSFQGFVNGLTGHDFPHYEISKSVGELLRDMTVGLFAKDVDELDKIIPCDINLDKAIHAKSEFFMACISNTSVSGVGFTEEPEFPIKRSSFPLHIARDRTRPAESEFKLHEAVIISPVDVDKDIQWKFQDTETNSVIRAYMRDESFKRKFLNGEYPVKNSNRDDVIKMLVENRMEERNGELVNKDTLVRSVFSFNDTQISPIPDNVISNYKSQTSSSLPLWDYR